VGVEHERQHSTQHQAQNEAGGQPEDGRRLPAAALEGKAIQQAGQAEARRAVPHLLQGQAPEAASEVFDPRLHLDIKAIKPSWLWLVRP